jgi:seryl-tRNA synthetase
MLDPRFVADNPDVVKDSLRRRHADPSLLSAVDTIVDCARKRSSLIGERDGLLNKRNTLSKEIGGLMRQGKRDEAEGLKAEVARANERIPAIEQELAGVEELQHGILMQIPNLLHASVPEGTSEDDNPVVRKWGEPGAYGFEPQAHVEIGEKLGILDLERAAKLTGTRFAVLKGAGARLERALINFFLDTHTGEHGYTEVMTPYMVHRRIMEGTGQLPKFEEDMFKLDRPVNGADTFLIPTAEVPVTNLHREEILEEEQLPVRYACFTPCFRAEAGSAGRDVRGIIRQHQFHKVELVWVTTPDRSEKDHQALVNHAEVLLQKLGLPYRVVQHCGGEVSFNAHVAYDLEVWLPSQNKYREISSCSNFGDYQARRMQLRYRPGGDGKAKPKLAHTLNGSGLAVGRTLVAILENYQQADGSVVVPEVLRPYMGGLDRISA